MGLSGGSLSELSKLTRRTMLGLTATGAIGLGACGRQGVKGTRILKDPDPRSPYPANVSFQHGVASGDPLPDRVILWTRVTPVEDVAPSIPVSWGMFADRNMTKPLKFGLALAERSNDWCVKVDVDGLEPDTNYYYRFVAKGADGDTASDLARTKTTALTGSKSIRLAIVCCSNWQFGLFNAYRALSKVSALDAIIHLGDYIYEYGVDGYGGDAIQTLGRAHEPPTELLSLEDYRARHAQYKTDADLQAAHAAAPWICTWDDHEVANNSYSAGAENHNIDEGEGIWSARKQNAVQAWLEWMPARDPQRGDIKSAMYRTFNFGDVASVHALETRLTGRSVGISWLEELRDVEPQDIPAKAGEVLMRVNDPKRTMLGAQQEDWLAGELEQSVQSQKAWQVLANQTIMARTKMPNFQNTLTDEQYQAQTYAQVKAMFQFSALGLPWNLDAWDGFPAARERLYASAKEAGSRLVVLTGDSHSAWANTLIDDEGERRGIEIACTSVTSPGMASYVRKVDDLGAQFVQANEEINWHAPDGHGYTVLDLTQDDVSARFIEVSSIMQAEFETRTAAQLRTERAGSGMTSLQEI